MLGKNIQDELRAIDHAPIQRFVNIPLLARRQARVKNYQISLAKLRFGFNLFQLAASNQRRGIGSIAKLQDRADHISARAFGEFR